MKEVLIKRILWLLMLTSGTSLAQDRPNFLIIVADDLGYADVGYHHLSKDIPTKNIDKLAEKGVVFKNGYVTAPVCGPSRAALLTGSYQQRFGFKDNPGPFRPSPEVVPGISDQFPTIAEKLQEKGYATVAIGKWHLGGQEDRNYLPLQKGFDHYYGFLGGASSYYFEDECSQFFMEDDQPIKTPKTYLTDLFGQKAIDYIDAHDQQQPFFMYWAPNAVHTPLEAPQEVLAKFDHIKDPNRKKLVAMQYVMDQNIGKIIQKLKEKGIYENTMIVFISDNGGKPGDNASLNLPLNGEKGTLFEGGIKTPYLMHFPAQLPNGKIYEPMVSSMDIYPTLLSFAGIPLPVHIDGVNLIPFVTTDKHQPHHQLFWKNANKWCVRHGDWKLFYDKKAKKERLYHISADPYEKEDLYKKNPEKVEELKTIYAHWDQNNSKIAWGWNPSAVGKYKVHNQFTFEEIIPERFESKQFQQVEVIQNPHKKGLNQSEHVLELEHGESTSKIRVSHAPMSPKELGYCHLKIYAKKATEVEVHLKLGDETEFNHQVQSYTLTGQWQDLVFDYSKFKGKVKGLEIVFKGKNSKIFVDDIWWNKNPEPITVNDASKVEQIQLFSSIKDKNKKVLTWKPIPNVDAYEVRHKGIVIATTVHHYVQIEKGLPLREIKVTARSDHKL
ncbi:sulfatase [Flammeovirga sp. EKP202]|uniref:sulfatase family protein n=1 Tax=Flammeovirga sp. EKP202 TaxID=2770592 RepID=UPI00165FDACC|nr:sulfatase-like hydrolase/transferase [Flammeovirga sp. EKP202]MBD0400582.1 sulfatase-like hydrolase/transferase [Flammeovirga sp. EKP202]